MSDYFDEFIDKDELEPSSEQASRPAWVTNKNSSAAAYEAIQSLYNEKLRYIRNHSKKVDFNKKGNFEISKSEVAKVVGVKMQAIFHSVNYAEFLKKELNEANEKLHKAKDAKLAKRYSGNNAKTKDELIKSVRELKARDEQISSTTTDQVLERTLDRLPLDVKRKLKLV